LPVRRKILYDYEPIAGTALNDRFVAPEIVKESLQSVMGKYMTVTIRVIRTAAAQNRRVVSRRYDKEKTIAYQI
jgi:hypothetical protein